ncbi:hypothetical protein U8527_16845 [Kordia algicida OT-1]|uniref:Hypothetical exported 24-amino acid repeat protein n=1 Tax=Kordia algicida OT-1 TaxID=391587 RepID=A9EB70_9FLAO|nr:toxin-antitoxin system YwqK family antitoxin [Kordia algicida]EDP94591.1 Hypothetical exported 24-amino acid repeat protein [Kordia algicida OT-1]
MKLKFTLLLFVFSTVLFAQTTKQQIYDEMMAYGKQEFLKKVAEIGNGKYEKRFYNAKNLEFSYTVKNGKLNGAFTQYFKNGNIYIQGFYKDNSLDGKFIKYYKNKQAESIFHFDEDKLLPGIEVFYENGKPKVTETFDETRKLRIGKEFYKNGKLRSLLEYVMSDDNLISGTQERFYESGKIKSRKTLKNSKPVGKKEEFREDGKLEEITNYNDKGEKHGVSQRYYENGKLQREENYVNGKQQGVEKAYFENGTLREEVIYDTDGNYDGKHVRYYKNGKVRNITNYKNDEQHGEEKYYHENGKVSMSGMYKNGESVGEHITYREDGTVKNIIVYNDEGEDIEYRDFDENGTLIKSMIEIDETHTVFKEFFSNGKLKLVENHRYNKKNGEKITYFDNGQLRQKLIYNKGKLVENVACFDRSGKKINNGDFANGNGLVKFYNADGKLYKEAIYKNGLIDDVTNYDVD